MEQYGDFLESINRLESSLSEVRCVWTDQTAQTYDRMNENMEAFTMQIWAYYCNSVSGYEAVKANYNEAAFDVKLDQLNFKIYSV